jgi:low affinity Fe/Cu permease
MIEFKLMGKLFKFSRGQLAVLIIGVALILISSYQIIRINHLQAQIDELYQQ